jgi:hypothetical protein
VAKICEDKGMKILTWLWYGGGIGSRGKVVALPQDAKGLKFRAAGKFFEHLLNTQGASITSMASSEIYMALQTKVLDACMTSAESFVSYRLYEQLEYFTPRSLRLTWEAPGDQHQHCLPDPESAENRGRCRGRAEKMLEMTPWRQTKKWAKSSREKGQGPPGRVKVWRVGRDGLEAIRQGCACREGTPGSCEQVASHCRGT